MTDDLMWLALSALLTAVLWVPYIVARAAVVEFPNPRVYRDPTPPEMPAWIKRLERAHQNAVESLVPFAALVLVAHQAGHSNEWTAMWAMVFFWARVAHAIVYWLGIAYVRTLAFAVGLAATFGVFFATLAAAPPSL